MAFTSDQRWPEFIPEALSLAEGQVQESVMLLPGELEGLLKIMRDQVPVEGEGYERALRVIFPSGKGCAGHGHSEWTALFYAEPAETPILVGHSPPISILPEPGQIVVMEPKTLHSVPKNCSKKCRLSIVMLVK